MHHTYTLQSLRQTLSELLAAQLGTFPNSRPAIWVETESAPVGTEGGVLVIIQPFYNLLASTQLINTQVQHDYEWIVTIRNFDSSHAKFFAAVERMRLQFPRCREVILPFREGVRLQVTYKIKETKVFNTYVE